MGGFVTRARSASENPVGPSPNGFGGIGACVAGDGEVHLLWQSGVAVNLDAGTVLTEIADHAIHARTPSPRACIGLLLQFFRRILVREREHRPSHCFALT